MVAVYRKVDAGELDFSQEIEIKEEDWAAGAGWLQWEKAGTKQTVGDLLLLMMTQSDNVATNALVRTVGGLSTSTKWPVPWGQRTRCSTRR